MIGELGEASLPDELPAFLHTPEAIADVGEYAREPDRSKASGKTHDSDRDLAHFLDLDDRRQGAGRPGHRQLAGRPAKSTRAPCAPSGSDSRPGRLSALCHRRRLAAGGQGDFAYWRILTVAIPRERDGDHRAYMARDLIRREALTLRDIGVWAHYVGDASQPMHVSTHFNGWGSYPNPQGYTQDKVHAPFEGAFVRAHITLDQVRSTMGPPAPCAEPIESCTARYLVQTHAQVEPFYALQKEGAFAGRGPARPGLRRQPAWPPADAPNCAT